MWDKISPKKAGVSCGYKTVLLMVLIAAFTVSCGKKGPLYIPKKTSQTEEKPTQADKVIPGKNIDGKNTGVNSKQAKE